MKVIKIILIALTLMLVSVSCYRVPLCEIRNAVVIEKGDRYNSIKVIEKRWSEESNQNIWFFQTYYLCEYEYKQVHVGDSLNYSKNIIVNPK